jgi:hypothetical protein|tara:strand:- start:1558 stop:1851 length:294 start_codon:yes stop_codon:yes gene_type:complete
MKSAVAESWGYQDVNSLYLIVMVSCIGLFVLGGLLLSKGLNIGYVLGWIVLFIANIHSVSALVEHKFFKKGYKVALSSLFLAIVITCIGCFFATMHS